MLRETYASRIDAANAIDKTAEGENRLDAAAKRGLELAEFEWWMCLVEGKLLDDTPNEELGMNLIEAGKCLSNMHFSILDEPRGGILLPDASAWKHLADMRHHLAAMQFRTTFTGDYVVQFELPTGAVRLREAVANLRWYENRLQERAQAGEDVADKLERIDMGIREVNRMIRETGE